MQGHDSIIKNSIFLFSSRALQIAVSFFIVIAVARYLSVEQYGEYSFILAFAGSITALTYFGIQQIVIREMAKDMDKAAHYLGVAILLRLIISVMVILIFLVVMSFRKVSILSQTALTVALVSEIFLSFNMLMKAVFQAIEKMVYEPLLTLLFYIILVTFISAVIYFNMGLLWLFIATASANLIQLIIAYRIIITKVLQPVITEIDRNMVVTFFKQTAIVGIGIFLYQNVFRINLLMLKWLSSTEDVALFNAPHSIFMQLLIVPTSIVAAIYPVFSRLLITEPSKALEIYRRTARYLLLISVLTAVYLSMFSREIIILVFGHKFINSSTVLMIVAWAFIPFSVDAFLNSILIAVEKQKYSIFYGAMTLLINFIAAYYILPQYGYLGASFIAVFSYTLLCLCSLYFVEKNGFPALFDQMAVKIFAIGIISMGAIFYVKQISIFLAIPSGISIYSIMIFKVLPEEDVLLLTGFMQRIFSKRRIGISE